MDTVTTDAHSDYACIGMHVGSGMFHTSNMHTISGMAWAFLAYANSAAAL